MGHPTGCPFVILAAAAIIIAAAAVVTAAGVVPQPTVVATAAEQDQQNDDPANVTTAEVIVTHNENLRKMIWRLSRSFQDIPAWKNGAKNRLPFWQPVLF